MIIKRHIKQLMESLADTSKMFWTEEKEWEDNDYRPETGGFQGQVSVSPAPATWGDFCDSNPRFVLNAGPGGFVAGSAGVTVGRFAWSYPPTDPNSANQIINNFGIGAPAGFIHREMQGLITTFLSDASMVIPQGFPVVVYNGGGFWAKNEGATAAVVGNKVYAAFGTGACSFAATGGAQNSQMTASITPGTSSFNGSIAGSVLTVTTVVSGTLVPGTIVTGGTGITSNTIILSQITGTSGSIGTYTVSQPEQAVTTALLTGTYGILTVATVTSGTLAVGDVVSGSGVTSGTAIYGLGTGVGLTGTYFVSPTQTAPSTTIITSDLFETKWFAMSAGAVGELIKISDHTSG